MRGNFVSESRKNVISLMAQNVIVLFSNKNALSYNFAKLCCQQHFINKALMWNYRAYKSTFLNIFNQKRKVCSLFKCKKCQFFNCLRNFMLKRVDNVYVVLIFQIKSLYWNVLAKGLILRQKEVSITATYINCCNKLNAKFNFLFK